MSTQEHDLKLFELNIKSELQEKVRKIYKTAEILIDTAIPAIMKDLGISRTAAAKLHKFVVEALADSKKKTDDAVHTQITQPLKIGADKEVVEVEDDITEEEDTRRYIIVEKRIDKFNIKRTRILVTPAVCEECGFDIVSANRLISYEQLSKKDQIAVQAALKEHIQLEHNPAEKKIVTQKELNASSWLHPSL